MDDTSAYMRDPFRLEEHALRHGKPGCAECGGLGIVFDPVGGGKTQGAFDVCVCVKAMTLGDGRPPYEYFNADMRAVAACPSRPARMAVDKIRHYLLHSGIPPRYLYKFFPSVDYTVSTSLVSALDFASDPIRNFGKEGNRGLYLHGPTGCGKTLIACAVINEIVRLYQEPVQYAKIGRDVLGRLRDSFNPNSDQYGEGQKIEAELARIPVLVIDDFGVHQETPWVSSVLYNLIDERYENNRITIITSNETLDSLRETTKGRLHSRLREMCQEIEIDAPDYRLRERKN